MGSSSEKMLKETAIYLLRGGSVMAECGPMRLVISSHVGKVSQQEMSMRAAEESFQYLRRVATLRKFLGKNYWDMKDGFRDSLAVSMVQSVKDTGDEDLTPMAAVAGTIGDAVADFLFSRGMTRVVVDNGGDVAVRIREGEPVRIGIRPEIQDHKISHVIELEPSICSWGVATSGLGGRSFTRGVASAATVVARTASMADAAATSIANASFMEDEHVVQRPAEQIQPDTDIPGTLITVHVGSLSTEKKRQALSGAMKKAADLIREDVIFGAFVAVQGKVVMTDFIRDHLVQ